MYACLYLVYCTCLYVCVCVYDMYVMCMYVLLFVCMCTRCFHMQLYLCICTCDYVILHRESDGMQVQGPGTQFVVCNLIRLQSQTPYGMCGIRYMLDRPRNLCTS